MVRQRASWRYHSDQSEHSMAFFTIFPRRGSCSDITLYASLHSAPLSRNHESWLSIIFPRPACHIECPRRRQVSLTRATLRRTDSVLNTNGQCACTAYHSADRPPCAVLATSIHQVIYELGPTHTVTQFSRATQTVQIIRGYTLDAPGGTITSVGVYFCRLQKLFGAGRNIHLTNCVQCVDRHT